MAKINEGFPLASVEPSLVIDLVKALADVAKPEIQKRLSQLEADILETDDSPEAGRRRSTVESLRAELESDYPGVNIRLTNYRRGQRSVQIDSGLDPVLAGHENSPAGVAEWVRTTDVDGYQLLITSPSMSGISAVLGISATMTISGYKTGGNLSVEVNDQTNTAESRIVVDSLLDSAREISSAFAAADANSEFPVFLGHGHGSDWKMLKDALENAGYPVLAFESLPRAGDVNINVIEASIRRASAAVLHLTPDDELANGQRRGRQNVVHEIGFAQGVLGVRQVVIVQHTVAESLSNLDGVSVIRYEPNSLYDKLGDLVANVNEIRARGGRYIGK